VLELADAWGIKMDHRKEQSHLFARIISGIENEFDVKSRALITEHELRAEIQQIRAISDLNRKGSDKSEVEAVIQNLSDGAKEKSELMKMNLVR
jgi:hypothetical protein